MWECEHASVCKYLEISLSFSLSELPFLFPVIRQERGWCLADRATTGQDRRGALDLRVHRHPNQGEAELKSVEKCPGWCSSVD